MTTELNRATGSASAALLAFDRAGTDTVLQTVPGLAQTLRELLAALSTPPADDVREAVDSAVRAALAPLHIEYTPFWKVVHAVRDSLLADPMFEVRPRGTVTDAARMEYTIAAEVENGAVIQLADYTTVVRDHLRADLFLFRQAEEEEEQGAPDRIFIAERPIRKWVRS